MVPYSKLSVYLCEGMCAPEADSSVRPAEARGIQRCRALPVAIPPSTLPLSGKDVSLFYTVSVSLRGIPTRRTSDHGRTAETRGIPTVPGTPRGDTSFHPAAFW